MMTAKIIVSRPVHMNKLLPNISIVVLGNDSAAPARAAAAVSKIILTIGKES